MFAYITAAPLVFIQHHHADSAHFGFFFGANAAGYIVASQLNARFLRTQTSLTLLTRGVLAALTAAALLAFSFFADAGLWLTALSCCAFLASLGFIMPNAVSLALEHQARHAGGASAWIGALQFGLAGLASATVSAGGTTLAMSATILTLTLLAALVLFAARTAVYNEGAARHQ
jgi:DHA1 family bicyclomycin/chloramphenicol resistance-like MFS transporter